MKLASRRPFALLPLALTLALFSPEAASGQSKKKDRKAKKEEVAPAPTPPAASEPAPMAKPVHDAKSIFGATAKAKKYAGLFTMFQDTTDGSAYLVVKKDKKI